MPIREMLIAAGLLVAFAVVGAGLVAYTHDSTEDEISANERLYLLRQLNQILPAEAYDNAITEDLTQVRAPEALGSAEALPVYRARRNGEPVAAILTTVAPNGYGGPIKLLVGVRTDGTVAGVRVVSHNETPGLGDPIDAERSDWIRGFTGKSLGQPPVEDWAVRKDGGVFDQFTGATITPRAVVAAVKRTLAFYQRHEAALFAAPAGGTAELIPPEPNERLNYPTERGDVDVRQ